MSKDAVLNKNLYKADLVLLKLLPIIMAISLIISTYGAMFQISGGVLLTVQIVSHYLGLVLAPMMFMYISSKVFQFCNYHRMFIHYILIIELMNVTNWYFKIPISNLLYNSIQDIITVIFLLMALGMYIYKKRQSSKNKNPGSV